MSTPMPEEHAKLIASVKAAFDKFLNDLSERLRLEPLDERFATSVMLLAPTHGNDSSPFAWVMTCEMVTGDWPNGKMQAYELSRDLISVLAMLEADYQLGIPHLPELLGGHPLMQRGPRVVTELAVSGAVGSSSNG